MKTKSADKPRRHWLQFSLRGLLLAILLIAIGLGWIISKRRPVGQEARAVAEVERLGGHATRSFVSPPRIARQPSVYQLRVLLFGPAVDRPVTSVRLSGCTDPDIIEHFRYLRALEFVELPRCQIGDDELSQLVTCQGIERLDLSATNITDEGVARLRSLPALSRVKLDHTAVTANGLEAFAGRRLEHISIKNTSISNEAAEQFHAAHPELKWFDHECSRSEQERIAIKRLIQLGASFPGYQSWGYGLLPEGTTAVRLCDGIADLVTPWQGRPEDLDLLDSIDSRIHVMLQDSVCASAYLERLAQLDTVESLYLQVPADQADLLAYLSGMQNIEKLSVRIIPLKSGNAAALASGALNFLQLPDLEELSAKSAPNLSEEVVKELQEEMKQRPGR